VPGKLLAGTKAQVNARVDRTRREGQAAPVFITVRGELVHNELDYLACLELRRPNIEAIVLAEENGHWGELLNIKNSFAERPVMLELYIALKRAKEHWLKFYPKTEKGGRKKKTNGRQNDVQLKFTTWIANPARLSTRSIERALEVVTKLHPSATQLLLESNSRVADEPTELRRLVMRPRSEHQLIARLVVEQEKSVTQVLQELHPGEPLTKVKLETEVRRFLNLAVKLGDCAADFSLPEIQKILAEFDDEAAAIHASTSAFARRYDPPVDGQLDSPASDGGMPSETDDDGNRHDHS